ncbi:uncharacterized protein A4U43_C08F19320 [Asparagus officinalis]|nr:uncharacterized protein A4U43_C08F19320 [Asparagus officinalis]
MPPRTVSASSFESCPAYPFSYLIVIVRGKRRKQISMSHSGSKTVRVDNTLRRKWKEQEEEEDRFSSKAKAPPIQRKALKHRDYEVNLESRLGKTQV